MESSRNLGKKRIIKQSENESVCGISCSCSACVSEFGLHDRSFWHTGRPEGKLSWETLCWSLTQIFLFNRCLFRGSSMCKYRKLTKVNYIWLVVWDTYFKWNNNPLITCTHSFLITIKQNCKQLFYLNTK